MKKFIFLNFLIIVGVLICSVWSDHIDINGDGSVLKLLLVNGTGDPPLFGAHVDVSYTVEYDGEVYQEYADKIVHYKSRRSLPVERYKFFLGTGSVVEGLDDALFTMKVNETSSFFMIPSKGYGSASSMSSFITFNVTLHNFWCCSKNIWPKGHFDPPPD